MSLSKTFTLIKKKLDSEGVSSFQFHYYIDDPQSKVQNLFIAIENDSNFKPRMEEFDESFWDNENNDLIANNLWFRKRIYFSQINLKDDSSESKEFSLKFVQTKSKNEGLIAKEKINGDVENLFNQFQINPKVNFPKKLVSYSVKRIYLLDEAVKYSLYLDQATIFGKFYFVIGCSCVNQYYDEFERKIEEIQSKFKLPNVKQIAHSKVFLALFLTENPAFLKLWVNLYPNQSFNAKSLLYKNPIFLPKYFSKVKLGVFSYADEKEEEEEDGEEYEDSDQ